MKPGNIMLTRSGAKLLDFGLAKVRPVDPDGAVPAPSGLPTRRADLTAEGSIVGTLQYMAPEQLEGREADSRADIFSFGSVLYEMVTGKKAFEGKSQASVIGAILHTEPRPVSAIQPMTPPALDRVVASCLAKDPEARWQHAGDLASELAWIAESGSQAGMAALSASRRSPSRLFLWGALAGLVLGFASALPALLLFGRTPPEAARGISRFSVRLPPSASLALYGAPNIAISPNGRWLAFEAEHEGVQQVYLRSVDRVEATPVPGTEGGVSVFFSPDSRWLGFASGGRLRKTPVGGGPVETICDAMEVRGASWAGDGTIVYSTGTSGLRRVPASGGASRQLTTPAKGESGHLWPQILSDHDAVIFISLDAAGSHVGWASLTTGETHALLDGTLARYSPSGHLLFMRSESLMAAPFDARRMEATGPAVPLVESVLQVPPLQLGLFDVSNEGTLVYAAGGRVGLTDSLLLVDRQGEASPLAFPARAYEEPQLSPDGTRFAVTLRDRNADIWIDDLSRGTLTRLTFNEAEDETPVWTPDGRRITYASAKTLQARTVFWKPADGSLEEEPIFFSENHPHVGSWSADGRVLAYTDFNGAFSGDIWIARRDGRPGQEPLLRTSFNECAPRFSPTGSLLAYVSNESGRDEVYVQAFPGPGGRWQISNEGGTEPVWSRDGRAIFYRARDAMMEVNVAVQPTFSAGAPHRLFSGRYQPTRRGDAGYDVGPDGRFLMVRRNDETAMTDLTVVLDWASELRK